MVPVSVSSVQLLSHVRLCDPMNRSTPGLPVHHQLQEFTQTQSIESVMPSSHLILCRPLLLLPPILLTESLNIGFIYDILSRSFKKHTREAGAVVCTCSWGGRSSQPLHALPAARSPLRDRAVSKEAVSSASVHALSPDVGPEGKAVGRVAR